MKRSFPGIVALVLAALIMSGCNRSEAAATKPPAPTNIDELKKAVADILARHHIPGIGIALVSKDKVIWTGGVGKADLATGRDVGADTMFRIGSITKGFVALSLLQLQAQGKIALDAKVADLAPEVPIVNPWEQTDPVRLANLLEHTAGFDDFPSAELYAFDGDQNVPLLKTLQMFPEPQRVRWRPGYFASYANPGYGIAGYILEKTSGQPCEDYIAAHILRPLGMTHSDMRLTPDVKAALAQGYEYDPPLPVPYLPILLRSAGDLKSSPNEMARFVRMMLNRGSLDGVTIVSPDSITRMETAKTTLGARNGLQYGYGLGNSADVRHDFVAHGHDGGLDGFLSAYQYLPDQGVGYFFSINDSQSGAPEKELVDLIFAYITRGMNPPAKPAAMPLDAKIESAPGLYELATPRQQWTKPITDFFATGWTYIKAGGLFRRGLIPGPPEKMIYLGSGEIRTEKESAASGVYCPGPDGHIYGCGELSTFQRISPVWPVARFLLILSALLIMVSSMLFALIWIPRKLLGRMRGVRHLSARILPLLATLSLVAIIWLFARESFPVVFGQVNAVTIAIFVLSIAFPLLSIASVLAVVRSWRFEMNRAARVHSMLAAAACFGVAWFFAYWGLIAVRMWAL